MYGFCCKNFPDLYGCLGPRGKRCEKTSRLSPLNPKPTCKAQVERVPQFGGTLFPAYRLLVGNDVNICWGINASKGLYRAYVYVYVSMHREIQGLAVGNDGMEKDMEGT